MDGNFNNENDFNQEVIDTTNDKKFDEVAPDHLPEAQGKAKTAFDLGLIALLGSIACIFFYFVLARMLYIMVVLPVLAIGAIVVGIMALKNDKGLPKAWIGIILGILSIIPSLICVFLFLWELFLYRLV